MSDDLELMADQIFHAVESHVDQRTLALRARIVALEGKVAELERGLDVERRLAVLEAAALPSLRSVGR